MQPCPGCGITMVESQMVCMSCGFNRATGKKPRPKVSKERDASAVASVAATVLIRANPLAWVAAAAVGAGIAGGAWYVLVQSTGIELRFLTAAIGVLAGVTVLGVAGRFAGIISGSIAAAVALTVIVGTHYIVFEQHIRPLEQKVFRDFSLSEEVLIGLLARDVALDQQARGVRLTWPPGIESPEDAVHEHEFPTTVWKEASERWARSPDDWKAQFKAEKEADVKGEYEAARTSGFLAWAFLNRSGLWTAFGVLAALALGSGGSMGKIGPVGD
jgi:hypothetical protein